MWDSVHRCILFVVCICLCAYFVSLWFACLRDHNDSLSIKKESCVVMRGWEVYEGYKHSCILHVDKWVVRRRSEEWKLFGKMVKNTGKLALVYRFSVISLIAETVSWLAGYSSNRKIITILTKISQCQTCSAHSLSNMRMLFYITVYWISSLINWLFLDHKS